MIERPTRFFENYNNIKAERFTICVYRCTQLMGPVSTDRLELTRHAPRGGCIKYDSYKYQNHNTTTLRIPFKNKFHYRMHCKYTL